MSMFDWQRWVGRQFRMAASSPRPRRGVRLVAIEALESRTLLTAPVVFNDFDVLNEDNDLPGTVFPLGFDADGDPLTFARVADPQHGTLVLNPNGTFVYTPNANYSGPDSFTFRANDGTQDSNVGTFNITVAPVNDAPVVIDDFEIVDKNQPKNGSLSILASDADADLLTYSIVSQPQFGTLNLQADGSYTYTPDVNYSGPDSFTFQVNDGTADSNLGTVNLNVFQNTAPVVTDGFANPNEDLAYPGTLVPLATDTDGDPLTFSVVAQPLHGTLALNASGTFTYTPNANYSGPDSFSFRANDGLNTSNVGVFNLNISPVDDGLKLTFPSATQQVPRNSVPVRIDPAVTLVDVDTPLSYANTRIRALISAGNSRGDYQKGRVGLLILNQGKGVGLVRAEKGQIYYGNNDVSIGTYQGGTLGRSLIVQFRNKPEVTAEAVNAVLRQLSLVASKKATSVTSNNQVGIRTVDVTVDVGNQRVFVQKSVSVV